MHDVKIKMQVDNYGAIVHDSNNVLLRTVALHVVVSMHVLINKFVVHQAMIDLQNNDVYFFFF